MNGGSNGVWLCVFWTHTSIHLAHQPGGECFSIEWIACHLTSQTRMSYCMLQAIVSAPSTVTSTLVLSIVKTNLIETIFLWLRLLLHLPPHCRSFVFGNGTKKKKKEISAAIVNDCMSLCHLLWSFL